MQSRKLTHEELKFMTSRIYVLANELFKNEFSEMYAKPKSEFMEWLNKKTGLNENIVLDHKSATINWLDKLEFMYKQR